MFRSVVRTTLWVTGILALIMLLIFLIVITIKSSVNPQPQDSQQAIQGISGTLSILAWASVLAFLQVLAIITLIVIVAPFILRKAFLWFARRVVNFILKKEQKDPIKIPLIILSALSFSFGFCTYLIDKLNH